MATNGLVLIKPTSTAVTGGSASATINAGGSVTFSLCESLSLNGVFSSAYDNYIINMRTVASTAGVGINLRMRVGGVDDSTANSYVSQRLTADSTSVSGARTTGALATIANVSSTQRGGTELFVYGPYLAQPTAGRAVSVDSFSSAYLIDFAWTHNQSTAYDGFTLDMVVAGRTVSGLVKVYGLVK